MLLQRWEAKIRLNRGSNSQPPGHESDMLTTEPPGRGFIGKEETTCHVQFRSFQQFYQEGHVKSCLYFQKVKEGWLDLFIEDLITLSVSSLCSY